AERNLSPKVRARVRELLADLPEYATLATAATWADQQAKLDPTFSFAFSSHYVNVRGPTTPRDLYRACLEQAGCVATGIVYYTDVLRSERASEQQKAEALRFVAHFVGDVHQPLHAGHREDKGGNDVAELRLLEYTPGRERTNLHAIWDGGIIAITMGRAKLDWQGWAVALDQQIGEDQRARWGSVGSVYDWVEESRLFAAANGYVREDGVREVKSGDVLGEEWYAYNRPIVEQRLQQAGVRLAVLLEDALGDG
ncbi:MAG: S1/P1 nuclease, partial [Deltaproteobacteria bacterium]|nr:S1/P1 nuclease [Deltaproteobacteria bacterium]